MYVILAGDDNVDGISAFFVQLLDLLDVLPPSVVHLAARAFDDATDVFQTRDDRGSQVEGLTLKAMEFMNIGWMLNLLRLLLIHMACLGSYKLRVQY